jgi:protein involved in polysaccharide export with SLBB domain
MDSPSCSQSFPSHLRWLLLVLLLGINTAMAQRDIPRATRVEPASQASGTYRLMVQDIISIVVFNEAELNTQARIDKDGAINMPMVGLVKLAGQSIREASATLETRLRKYLIKPQVTVTVLQYTKRKFTMLGQINKPGTYDMPDEGPVNLLEALGMAGGVSRIASAKITVTRTVDGREQVIELDRKAMSKDGSIKRFQVLPGDTIDVGERIF